ELGVGNLGGNLFHLPIGRDDLGERRLLATIALQQRGVGGHVGLRQQLGELVVARLDPSDLVQQGAHAVSPSRDKAPFIAAIATSTCALSGSRVVRRCKSRPGRASSRVSGTLALRAPRRSNS